MHPILLKIGNITLYTYGLFVALGFMSAIWFASWRARVRGSAIGHQEITDLFFVILLSSLVGARLFYVIQNFSLFSARPLDIFKIWNGGLVFYGGFIVALLAAMVYIKKKNFNLWDTADLLAPAIALGHAVGRVGCLFAGCCYGKTCDLPWAITFSDPHSLAPLGVPLHPTQLYAVLSNLILFILLVAMDRKNAFSGRLFWIYIFLYGIFRSFLEIFRGDERGDFLLQVISPSQTIGIVMALVAVAMLWWLSHGTKSSKAPKSGR
ncbi:phosphatidylglycerol:prolipoprotein diacylglycerol transferase [Desulfocicer vacuolatum DSM 3385]|uniref:Phosphatidylglycerol--prolipoprotein diacylglyceryl transferase n=1 Tax=Desulfocicer vacuolatum DSM 3385 TaxID=1121400 RepID=A0A1W1Z7D1_9BACT|nr:prolipoprotein diacylglyceryl transferase [Desulfocicer vacuolatum]SMC44350.1 phosphatidylglycerol:prolipoprotein diacylglycerol transferase [Desulfocicer vacuolatum DSM 3385]